MFFLKKNGTTIAPTSYLHSGELYRSYNPCVISLGAVSSDEGPLRELGRRRRGDKINTVITGRAQSNEGVVAMREVRERRGSDIARIRAYVTCGVIGEY